MRDKLKDSQRMRDIVRWNRRRETISRYHSMMYNNEVSERETRGRPSRIEKRILE